MIDNDIVLMDEQKWIYENENGEKTFCGCLVAGFSQISKKWKKVHSEYVREYINLIVPNLKESGQLAINSYTADDYEDVINNIVKRKMEKETKGYKPYSEDTLNHFRYLIKCVVVFGIATGECKNVIWGSEINVEDGKEEPEKLTVEVLQKSITDEEEGKIKKILLDKALLGGEYLGVLLMFYLGLRNCEACGVKYGDIHPMLDHPNIVEIYIVDSVKAGTNKLQASSKTHNGGRILYVPKECWNIICERKKRLLQVYSEKEINEFPIACKSNFFSTFLKAEDINSAAKIVFAESEFNEREFFLIEKELNDVSKDIIMKEKKATAYLLRRNYCTHLYHAGLSEFEIQYFMGHEIEDDYEDRNEFVNDERRYSIIQKMRKNDFFGNESSELSLSEKTKEVHLCNEKIVHFNAIKGAILHILANEPMDSIVVKVTGELKHSHIQVIEQKTDLSRTIQICSDKNIL